MTERTYLDWNATAPLQARARAAMAEAMDVLGNPSSVHAEGRAARLLLERARGQVAAAVGAAPRQVIFTSGGSEANALALSRYVEFAVGSCDIALVSAIEHASVRAGGDFLAVEQFACGHDGVASMPDLEARLQAGVRQGAKAPLVALMAANNETGVVQPVREAAALVHAAGGLLHVDAVQALGKIPLQISELGADLLAISAHKIGGPMGVGALVLGERVRIRGSRSGGGQEHNRRGGTENLVGIAGFGAAIDVAVDDIAGQARRLGALRQRLERGLRAIAPTVVIFGEGADRLANTLQFAQPGIRAQTALMALDLDGIAVSSGSACSSGTVRHSEVVRSMGYEVDVAEGAVRLSFGGSTTEADADRFLRAWRKLVQPLLKSREIAA